MVGHVRQHFNPYNVEDAYGENSEYYAWGFDPDSDGEEGNGWGLPMTTATHIEYEEER